MGTYAVYKMWAGVLLTQVDEDNPFIKKVLSSYDFVKKDNLLFEGIGMHGDKVGIGVKIQELSWEVEIGSSNFYDVTITNKAIDICKKVAETFKKLGVSCEPRIFHHIDLGG